MCGNGVAIYLLNIKNGNIGNLMAILDNMADENSMIKYLSLHKEITKRDDVFCSDELDVFGAFLVNPELLKSPPPYISGYSRILDEKYNGVPL